MRPELFTAFENELRELNTKLADERRALEALDDDGEGTACVRNTIEALEAEVSEVIDARNRLFGAEHRKTESIERFKKWVVLRRDIMVARERMAELPNEIRAAQKKADDAEAHRFAAQDRLAVHVEEKPESDPFIPPAKIRAWEKRKSELEAKLTEAVSARGAAVDALATIRGEMVELDARLNARPTGLIFQAERLAPAPKALSAGR